jgi:hypothetical protein
MAFFSNESPTYQKADHLDPEKAFVGIMYCLMASDGLISSDEIRDLKAALKRTRFMGNSQETYFDSLMSEVQHIYKHEGPESLLKLSCQFLPDDLQQAVFIFAVDISFSDGFASQEEGKILTSIKSLLHLDEAFTTKVIDTIIAKNSI